MLIHAEGAVPVDSTTVGYCWEKSEKRQLSSLFGLGGSYPAL